MLSTCRKKSDIKNDCAQLHDFQSTKEVIIHLITGPLNDMLLFSFRTLQCNAMARKTRNERNNLLRFTLN